MNDEQPWVDRGQCMRRHSAISSACRYHASASQARPQVQPVFAAAGRDRARLERAHQKQVVPMSTPSFSVYDGRQHIAVVEQRKDGWYVVVRDRHIGVCADRESALRLVNATIKGTEK